MADLVQLDGKLRPRSRLWWQLFRMVSQWHVDVVIVERRTFSIVAAIELDDVSHLRPERKRRDILLEEVLRQAGIPLFRSHDAKKLQQMTGEWLDACKAGQPEEILHKNQAPLLNRADAFTLLSCPTPATGEKRVFPGSGVSD